MHGLLNKCPSACPVAGTHLPFIWETKPKDASKFIKKLPTTHTVEKVMNAKSDPKRVDVYEYFVTQYARIYTKGPYRNYIPYLF